MPFTTESDRQDALREIQRIASAALEGFSDDLPKRIADIENIARNAMSDWHPSRRGGNP